MVLGLFVYEQQIDELLKTPIHTLFTDNDFLIQQGVQLIKRYSGTVGKLIRCMVLMGLVVGLSNCVAAVAGAAVGVTVAVVKVPFKVAGAAVDLAIPDDKDDDEKECD